MDRHLVDLIVNRRKNKLYFNAQPERHLSDEEKKALFVRIIQEENIPLLESASQSSSWSRMQRTFQRECFSVPYKEENYPLIKQCLMSRLTRDYQEKRQAALRFFSETPYVYRMIANKMNERLPESPRTIRQFDADVSFGSYLAESELKIFDYGLDWTPDYGEDDYYKDRSYLDILTEAVDKQIETCPTLRYIEQTVLEKINMPVERTGLQQWEDFNKAFGGGDVSAGAAYNSRLLYRQVAEAHKSTTLFNPFLCTTWYVGPDVNGDHLFITAAHCVDSPRYGDRSITIPGEGERRADVAFIDRGNDLAVLRVRGEISMTPIRLAPHYSDPLAGFSARHEEIEIPRVYDKDWPAQTGSFTCGLLPRKGDIGVDTVRGGYSGGVWMGKDGAVGMTSSTTACFDPSIPQTINIIRIEKIRDALLRCGWVE
jgi:hypothetical protein